MSRIPKFNTKQAGTGQAVTDLSLRPRPRSKCGPCVQQVDHSRRLQMPRTPAVPSTPISTLPRPHRVVGPLEQSIAGPTEYGPQVVKGKRMVYSSSGLPMKHMPAPGVSGIGANQVDPSLVEELFDMSREDVCGVEDQVYQELINMSTQDPESRVYTKGHRVQQTEDQVLRTPFGLEPVLQQTYTEKRVEKDQDVERVVRNLSIVDTNDITGHGVRITMSEQQLDPNYGLYSQGKDTTTVKETVAVTPSCTTTARQVVREATKPIADFDPIELERLVEEETEDVENTLRMAPPDLSFSPEKYGIKQRLRKLRMNSESMAVLEQSVVNPTSTADEALAETPPEALATIMHTIESGVAPQCTPNQVFNSLFEAKALESSIMLSSVGPGPLQDVVVPQEIGQFVHKGAMTASLNKLTEKFKNTANVEELPNVDIFSKVMNDLFEEKTDKTKKIKPFKPIVDEEIPWADEDIEAIVNIVGAEPIEILDPIDIKELEDLVKLEKKLTNGIEYFVDADPVQYISRVQLRGTNTPDWFPGYIFALPEFSKVVKVTSNPDEVFYSSWKSCQPKIIPEQSVSILH